MMTHPRHRRGITLTEILISILILGVGVTSIMTLFPLGLMNVRQATRLSRSAYLTESATSDLEGRDLLNKQSFLNSNVSPWYTLTTYTPWPYDPWVQDTPSYGGDPILGPTTFGVYSGNGSFNTNNPGNHNRAAPYGFVPGPGLPVAYDPLWRYQAGVYLGAASEARFASGIGFIRPDPSDGSSDPSAHGLQRITNFNPTALATWLKPGSAHVADIFVSPEDVVLQSETDASKGVGGSSPIVPDMTLSANASTGMAVPTNDWKYTWMFTGQQADCTNGTVFTGDIVVFENRPFAVDPMAPTYFSHNAPVAGVVEGETVVEAVFGYTNKVTQIPPGGSFGYGAGASRAVLLRWSDKMPDPEIRVGSWIADVTYERVASVDRSRRFASPAAGSTSGLALAYFPYQRCHWYQIAKRTQASTGQAMAGDPDDVTYREMTVWTSVPLRSFTLLNPDGSPHHANAALVSPYVVNVFPRTVYTR